MTREVICDDGVRVGFDYLIIGNGITTNHFGIPGAAEYTMSMYTRAEALEVGTRSSAAWRSSPAHRIPTPAASQSWWSAAGATGVEMAGQLAELKTETIPSTYPELNPARVHVVLVEMAEHLLVLRRLPAPVRAARVDQARRRRSAEDRDLGSTRRPSRLQGRLLDAGDLVIWAAGVSGEPQAQRWGCRLAGQVGSRSTAICGWSGEERIFAIGDASVIVYNPLAALAQPAIQMGKWAARQIARLYRGLETETFHYRDKDTMATIGRGDAVLRDTFGLELTGVLAGSGGSRCTSFYPARRAQPGPDLDQPRFPLRRTASLERHRRRRDGDAQAAGDECQGRTAGRCIASAPRVLRQAQHGACRRGAELSVCALSLLFALLELVEGRPGRGLAGMSGGQGRNRTGDLSLFRRTLLPTELPGLESVIRKSPLTRPRRDSNPLTSAVTGRRANQLRHGALWPRVGTLPGARETIAQHIAMVESRYRSCELRTWHGWRRLLTLWLLVLSRSPSSSGLGHRPFKAAARVRTPLGTQDQTVSDQVKHLAICCKTSATV